MAENDNDVLRHIPPPPAIQQIADACGGTIEECFVLPDGSGGATMSYPLPKTHWLTQPGVNVPPMPLRLGTAHARRQELAEAIRAAGKYAIRAATMNGADNDFDPDAMLQNLVVGLLGYWTPDGLSYGSVYLGEDPTQLDPSANPSPVPPEFGGFTNV